MHVLTMYVEEANHLPDPQTHVSLPLLPPHLQPLAPSPLARGTPSRARSWNEGIVLSGLSPRDAVPKRGRLLWSATVLPAMKSLPMKPTPLERLLATMLCAS